MGCSPWGQEESDTTERLHFHFSLSCIGEGNGNPLQCSCLENHRDGGAWWAAVYGVAQSRTRLKRLSSSSIGNTYWVIHSFHIYLVFLHNSWLTAPKTFDTSCDKNNEGVLCYVNEVTFGKPLGTLRIGAGCLGNQHCD